MLKKYLVLLVAVIGIFTSRNIPTEYTMQAAQQEQSQRSESLRQLHCLALNIYHEARSESSLGQKAVALVTMNRKMHPAYPDTVCGVVYQARLDKQGEPLLNKCQFSWFCDGKKDTTKNEEKWNEAINVATYVYENYGKIKDVTNGATMYHATYVRPYWKNKFTRTVKIESHVFYK